MKKVIHLISSVNIGGAETMVKDYAILTDKSKFIVKIISIDKSYNSANEKALKESGIPIFYLSELHFRGNAKLNIFQKSYRRIARYIDLYRIIKREKPDILHVHLFIGNYLRIIPINKWNIKLLYTVHNIPSRFFSTNKKEKEKYFAYIEVRRLLKKCDLCLIALHEEMNQQLQELFHTKRVVTVNNGVVLDKFKSELYDRNVVRKQLQIDEKAFLVGHVGRFHEQKNHQLIMDIFQKLWNVNSNVYLLLVGNGPTRKEIESKVNTSEYKDHVIFLENRNDIAELMNAMDVFLFPSRWEGFGNVMIEAQSLGLHCVVSNKIPKDAIINSNVDVLSLNDDLDVWTKAIKKRNNKIISREQIEKYDIRNSVQHLQEIYIKE